MVDGVDGQAGPAFIQNPDTKCGGFTIILSEGHITMQHKTALHSILKNDINCFMKFRAFTRTLVPKESYFHFRLLFRWFSQIAA